MEELYYSKKTGQRLGIILDKFESESSPGKWHQVRTADSTGETYCTCRGWVQALNHNRNNGIDGEAVCTHIKQYRQQPEAKPITIMDFESFASVKRGIHIKLSNKTVGDDVNVRRK